MLEGGTLPLASWRATQSRDAERFDAWQEALSVSHRAWALHDIPSDPFHASYDAASLDDIQLVHCACSPCSGLRGDEEISADAEAPFGLLYVLEGCEEVTVGSRQFNLEPGLALLWESTEPIRFRARYWIGGLRNAAET